MKLFTAIAVVAFILVTSLHLVRILWGWEGKVGGVVIPMWVSYLGLIVAGGLAVMLWRESRRG